MIRTILWIIGLSWLFTSPEAKNVRKYIGLAVIISWVLFIILGVLCSVIDPTSGKDMSHVNGGW